jgi:hypothetical protein
MIFFLPVFSCFQVNQMTFSADFTSLSGRYKGLQGSSLETRGVIFLLKQGGLLLIGVSVNFLASHCTGLPRFGLAWQTKAKFLMYTKTQFFL